MRKVRSNNRKIRLFFLTFIIMCLSVSLDVNAGERQQEKGWKMDGDSWFFYNDYGVMATGWHWVDERWYFLNPGLSGMKGQMLTGWQWINGRCYYLAEQTGVKYLKGAMYVSDMTPDGYVVGDTGAWTEGNKIIEISGKGIQTEGINKNLPTGRSAFVKGSGGGSGSGKQSYSGRNHSASEKKEKESDTRPQPSKPAGADLDENNNAGENSGISGQKYKYTVKYVDVTDRTILQVMTGIGKKGETIPLMQEHIDGYRICKGQKKSFRLAADRINVMIYYEKITPLTPSEAQKVNWELKFIEVGKTDREIFIGQKGKTEEGKELFIDFPETIIGNDQYYYHSLVPSPWSVVVNGNGIQKYYIEYRKGDHLPEEPDPNAEGKERLNYWLDIAGQADKSITGEEPADQQIITGSQKEGNERLLNLVSMADGTDRKEVYLIGKGYPPNASVIGQKFPMVKNISELSMERFIISDETYTVLRVGFEKTYEESTCSHDYEIIDEVAATCTENGHLTVCCKKCGKEETVILPAKGHADADHDGICGVCQEPADEIPEAVHYSIGDLQIRSIGDKLYLFRCIDDDFEDAMENSQKLALFLCDSIIRSDINGASKKFEFGNSNNYKYSKVRDWLLENANDDNFVHQTYIGMTYSYLGVTPIGAYEQFSENCLNGERSGFQQMQDRVFILSVDEAIKYKDYLWKFNGSQENNPESQLSAYSRGYYLRTPQTNGQGIYVVSLVDGNIRPTEISDTSIGIRPVMAVTQS